MRLVQSFAHFYARWDDPATGEEFNIEGSNSGGLDFHDDDYYRNKAKEMGTPSLEAGNYFQSMSPREELSSFVAARADCLRENGRWVEALEVYRQAVKLAPQNHFAAGLLRTTIKVFERARAPQQAEAAYQRHERRRRTDPRLMIPGMLSAPAALPTSVRPAVVFNPTPVIRRSPTGPVLPMGPTFRVSPPFPRTNNRWQPRRWGSLNVRAAEVPSRRTQQRTARDVFENMKRRNGIHSQTGDWP